MTVDLKWRDKTLFFLDTSTPTFKIIFTSILFGFTTITTLGTLYGNGIFRIDRKWWDDDYDDNYKSNRAGKTSLKGKIKGIFIALLINFIFYLLFYIIAKTKFYIGFIPIFPVFLYFNMQKDGSFYI